MSGAPESSSVTRPSLTGIPVARPIESTDVTSSPTASKSAFTRVFQESTHGSGAA